MGEQSFTRVINSIVDDATTVVQGTVDLARTEIKEQAKSGAAGFAMAILALGLVWLSLIFLLVAAAFGLVAAGLTTWGAFLVVAGVMLFLAVIFIAIGAKSFKKVRGPVKTIESVSKTIKTVNNLRDDLL
jgi:uncharacterized membrane protein YqjE